MAAAAAGVALAMRGARLAVTFPQIHQRARGKGKQSESVGYRLKPPRGFKQRQQRQEAADGPEDQGESGQADQNSDSKGFPHRFDCSKEPDLPCATVSLGRG